MGGAIVTVIFLGIIEFLGSRECLPRPLLYLLAYVGWAGLNAVVAISNGVEPSWWLRRFFPIVTLAFTTLASMVAFRTGRRIISVYFLLSLLAVVIVAQALLQLSGVDVATVSTLQALRRYGGYIDTTKLQ